MSTKVEKKTLNTLTFPICCLLLYPLGVLCIRASIALRCLGILNNSSLHKVFIALSFQNRVWAMGYFEGRHADIERQNYFCLYSSGPVEGLSSIYFLITWTVTWKINGWSHTWLRNLFISPDQNLGCSLCSKSVLIMQTVSVSLVGCKSNLHYITNLLHTLINTLPLNHDFCLQSCWSTQGARWTN